MVDSSFISRQPDYSDLDLDFFRNPSTNDVTKKRGIDAIKRSVRNLIMTNFYDRPFRSSIGSGIRELLFENSTPLTSIIIQKSVKLCLEKFEPRVRVTDVKVEDDVDNYRYNVTIDYVIINRELPIIQTLFLERIR